QCVLRGVRSLTVGFVEKHNGRTNADKRQGHSAWVGTGRAERVRKRIVQNLTSAGCSGDLRKEILHRIEHRVTRVLRVEDSAAGAYGPFWSRTPRDPQAGRPVGIIDGH